MARGSVQVLTRMQSLPGEQLLKALHFSRKYPLGSVGLVIVFLLFVVAAAADVLAPADPFKIEADRALHRPDAKNLLGTDEFGRDLLSRIIFGARISLAVGFGAALLGNIVGGGVAVVSAYLGGKVDTGIQRVMDVLMAFPALVLAMAMVAALGPSLRNVIYAIAFAEMPRANRIVRASVLSVKTRDYITAAQVLGARTPRIMAAHIMPNVFAPWLIVLTASVGGAIIAEASLSFLGLGLPPPSPSWGLMLSGSAQVYAETAPWVPVFPGLAITFSVFGFNMFGDAVRDALDPRLRGSR